MHPYEAHNMHITRPDIALDLRESNNIENIRQTDYTAKPHQFVDRQSAYMTTIRAVQTVK